MVEAYWKGPDLIWFQATACSVFAETLSQKNGFSFGFCPLTLEAVPGAAFSGGGCAFDGTGGPGCRGGTSSLFPPGGGGGGRPDPSLAGGGGGPGLLPTGGRGPLGGGGGGPGMVFCGKGGDGHDGAADVGANWGPSLGVS